MYRSMRKHGVENFSIVVLEETTKELINIRESYHIQTTNPELNMTVGGDGGSTTHSRMWVNNGIDNKYILKSESIPEGFVRGRLCKFNDSLFQQSMSKRAHDKMTPQDYKNRGEAISKGKLGKPHIGIPHSVETKLKLKQIALSRKTIQCEHCNKLLTPAMFSRWHGNRCKYATNIEN